MPLAFPTEESMKPMLPAVAHRLARRRRHSVSCVFEVAAARGVPDVVAVDFLARFADRPPVTDSADLAVWLALTREMRMGDDAVSTAVVASWVGLSSGYVGQVSLPRLRERGLVDGSKRGRWVVSERYAHRVRTLATIELKLKDWRQGIRQAALHGRGADHSWLVLDGGAWSRESSARGAAAAAAQMRGVGLATLSADGRVTLIAGSGRSTAQRTLQSELSRAVLAERSWDLVREGRTSGPVYPVFGRELSELSG